MKDEDHLRIRAAFDQASTAARHAGGKMVEVSEIELICLATMAKYGLYAYLHRNGPFLLEELKEKLDNMDRVIRSFGTFKEGDTPPFLANSAAVLYSEHIDPAVMEWEGDGPAESTSEENS